MKIIKSIKLHATNGATCQLQAVDLGEYHPQTATGGAAWGFLALRLQSRFWTRLFRYRITGKAALEILEQIDNRAPEFEPVASAFLDFVSRCVRNHRENGTALTKT